MRLITLTSDFGQDDWFVGSMKGVILSRHPRAAVVDLTHGVPRGDVCAGAFTLLAAFRCFPPDTIHVAVVDPGVGSPRPAIAVRTADYFLVGPDNGLLSFALAHQQVKGVRRVQNERLFRHPVSRTFHGRDVFAPIAAHLSAGGAFASIGPAAKDWIRLPWPKPQRTGAGWAGEVIYVDHFGNAITNLANALFAASREEDWEIRLSRGRHCSLARYYEAVPRGQLAGFPGSSGFLELAVNAGNAARQHGLKTGFPVRVRVRARGPGLDGRTAM